MENNDEVYQFYESYNENERMERHPIEFVRSREIISRYLPSTPIKIADLCGASGHYAYWLAERGHEVHLMDLSEKHIKETIENKTKYFTNAYFHSMKEIHDELLFSGYNNIIVYGVEGFSTLLNEKEYVNDNRKLNILLEYLKLFEQDIEMMGVSHHRLAICRK